MDGDDLIVLDTHAWIWWVSAPEKLSDATRERIERASSIGMCAISCWEVAMLVAKDRLRLDRDVLAWLRQALRLPRVRLLALSPEIAVAATRLAPPVPPDPADRIILASAAHHAAALVTRDLALRAAGVVESVW